MASPEPIQLIGGPSYEASRNKVLDGGLAENISASLPTRLQLHTQWKLKYSLELNGASLRTLYDLSKPSVGDRQQHGYLLVVKDANGGRLGGYANEPFKPTEGTHYTGNGDCFLWREPTKNAFKCYKYTGVNDFVLFCTNNFLSLGGGDGHYGLWLDDDLNNGVSRPVPTFNNEDLSSQGSKFQVVALELWQI